MSRVDRFWENAAQSPLQIVKMPLFAEHGVRVYFKRDDLLHPFVSGNKWRKLKYNLLEAERSGFTRLLTFGGAYSNHIAAVAAAGQATGFKTTGIIRGEELTEVSNKTLQYASQCGMKLQFVTREAYRDKIALAADFGTDCYVIPEGGSNALAVKGVQEVMGELQSQLNASFDYLCTAFGTGGTASGLISAPADTKVLVFPALNIQKAEVLQHIETFVELQGKKIEVLIDYHFGGYGKETEELTRFIADFEQQTLIPLEQVYTGKMMYGLVDLIRKGYFRRGEVIVVLHTGGLQGKRK
ncbi:1-aminocyclopropane-1-carboxylate deaminase/D-cysteine desulfhydrase [Runella slithyformis]|uniref:Pyridoxal-5'-phosphate-dependent protein subunit beta n=1 Tax=Runella slithyformis (strain ATCC 29530 / DSM 19594 / LMG 11500 / NCIMB 11436 / LSU 4) TaxID=761193 RepID=A0A7U3ZPB9_RUNSL|nr:pyridoxal-phosphate dependent enzyme [Runella slithyformis]AEI50885.1 pyridoxal-5'-phosphate-dependent protein subunit beta [Runella slithyformis DSM 19594]